MKRAAAAILALGLAACRTADHAPSVVDVTLAGAVSDQRLDDTHFRLVFVGRDISSRRQVDEYLLYRAAELATVQGYGWFEMAGRRAHNAGGAHASQGFWRPSWTVKTRPGVGPWAARPWGAYDIERFESYQASVEVVVGRGARPANDPWAYDAVAVMKMLDVQAARPG